MIRAQGGRSELRDLPVTAPRLVDVAQLAGHAGQVERQHQQDRVLVAEPVVPGRQRLLQHPAGLGQVAQADREAGEVAGGRQYVRIVHAERRGRGVDGLVE
jgi:hypothetical protein